MKKNVPFIKNKIIRCLIPVVLLLLLLYFIVIYSSTMASRIAQIGSLLFAVYLIIRGLREPFIFNPYFLFAVCPLTLALYFPVISEYYLLELSDTTYVYALVNMICFYIGLEIIRNKKIRMEHGVLGGENHWPNECEEKTVRNWAIVFSVVGMIPAVYALLVGHISEWNRMKDLASSFPIYAVLAYFPYIGIYLAMQTKKKVCIIICLVLGGVATLVSLTKTMVLCYLMAILAAYEKKHSSVRIKRLILLGIISLFVFSYLDGVYNQMRGATKFEELWLSRSSSLLSVSQLKTYLYFETPWANLEYVLGTVKEHTYGLWSVKPILTLFRIEGLFTESYSMMESYTTFNAMGYLAYLYNDFGVIGSCVAVMPIGMFVSYVYERGKRNLNPFWGVIVLFTLRAVLMMFFNLHFSTEIYILTTLIIMCIVNYFSNKGKKLKRYWE